MFKFRKDRHSRQVPDGAVIAINDKKARMTKFDRSFIRHGWKRLLRLIVYLFIAQLLYLVALRWVNPPTTWTMLTDRIGLAGSQSHFYHDWVPYEKISSQAGLAVIAGEDQLFPEHDGFDIKSIRKAIEHNQHSRRIRGASTISQQTAKNVFLWQGRSWVRKGLEVYFTFMIEKLWGKKRILEVYLNVAQMGPHLYGIQAAARQYFHKDASALTRSEAALIAAALPNPVTYKVAAPSTYLLRRRQWIVGQMYNLQSDPDIRALLPEH